MLGRIGLGELFLILAILVGIVIALRSSASRRTAGKPPSSARQKTAEIRKLAYLRKKGLLTDAEFEREKRRVLED